MSKPLIVTNQIVINASAPKVWNALVNPAETKKYMFGCEAISDWKIGSPLVWNAIYEGKEMTFVKGTIVDIKPEKFLAYTTIDPNGSIADVPENYLTVTYALTSQDQGTLLTVTQGDYSTVAEGAKRYEETYNNGEGWNPILIEIKKVVEAN